MKKRKKRNASSQETRRKMKVVEEESVLILPDSEDEESFALVDRHSYMNGRSKSTYLNTITDASDCNREPSLSETELQVDKEAEKDETDYTSIHKGLFARLVYEISDDLYESSSIIKYGDDESPMMWSKFAMEAIQVAVEDHVSEVLKRANLAAFHRDSDIVEPKDIHLAEKLHGFDATSGDLHGATLYHNVECDCGCRDGDGGVIIIEM
jgi:histone H3/H4